MRRHRTIRLAVLALYCGLTVLGGPAFAQHHPPSAGTPAQAEARSAPRLPPLLYVRFTGPAGMRVTFYRGGVRGQTLEVPFTVGLRPGYQHRIQLSDIPRYPGLTLFPTLEVRGSILMPPGVGAFNHPAALWFTDADFNAARAGGLVTRVVTVERPDGAIPVATRSDLPLEFTSPPGQDPAVEALRHGRPLLVVRLGQRQVGPDELARCAAPGTVLLPGERVLPLPRDRPCVPWTCAPVSDPRLGPYPPADEVCFHDGGDVGLKAGHDPVGRLRGVDPSDTVAEYADSHGRRKVAVSNRVCLCVPRFVVMRGETFLAGNYALYGPGRATMPLAPGAFLGRFTPRQETQFEQPGAVAARQRLAGTVSTVGTSAIGLYEGLSVVTVARETNAVTGTCPRPEHAEPPDGPLVLVKWPDRCDAQIGDVITFFLKYTNKGGQPMTRVAVTDSLTARLEYVPGSARADRDAVFTTQENEAGSVLLRWEVSGTLLPGESGVMSFQARVR